MKSLHAAWNCVLRQGSPRTSNIEMVDVDHAELGLQSHLLWEQGHEVGHGFFVVVLAWIVHKDYTVSIFLDWKPTVLVLQIS